MWGYVYRKKSAHPGTSARKHRYHDIRHCARTEGRRGRIYKEVQEAGVNSGNVSVYIENNKLEEIIEKIQEVVRRFQAFIYSLGNSTRILESLNP